MNETYHGQYEKMLVDVQKLANVGMDVAATVEPNVKSRFSSTDGLPGVRVRFGNERGARYHDSESTETFLTVESEEWEVAVLLSKLEEMKAEAEERVRRRALAEEAKKLLTPEQLAALRDFG
jgi:hypothetical protein